MSILMELGALFAPGLRHTIEEQRSEALRRKEAGKDKGEDLRIDLDSGVVQIRRRRAPAAGAAPADGPEA